MLPRDDAAELGAKGPARRRRPHRSWRRRTAVPALALPFLLLTTWCVAFGVAGATEAASQTGEDSLPLSRDNGLRELSGKSLRAFKNRVKRQLRGSECVQHHEAGDWWRYEWCVDRFVRQFHRPVPNVVHGRKASPPATNAEEHTVLLGVHNVDKARPLHIERVDRFDRVKNPDVAGFVAIEQYQVPGEFCAAANRSRSVEIQYQCCAFRANETYIERVEEPAVCSYRVRVCSPAACGLMQRDAYVLGAAPQMAQDEQHALAQTVKDMFYHAYSGYMTHAFPQDDLAPLSCRGSEFELGKLPMLTLIDTLDMLAILEDGPEFRRAVSLVLENASFDLDEEVSVFETTIRVLGGLLSAHMFAADATRELYVSEDYHGGLLKLAVDLGDRLLPAFDTATGIPYGTVNLRRGVPKDETPIASTAGAGSLSLEFTMLSVLTGDVKYAVAARRSVRALFDRRSALGLLGKHIDTRSGDWTETGSGPGSNSDSFYEYLLKMYMLFDDREALEMFATVYPAVLEHNLHGDWYADVSMWTGCSHTNSILFESLASFWPGMQAGAGHLLSAAKSMNAFFRVWREYGFLPEQFNVLEWRPVKGRGARYPLRPELLESTFYMHEATNDSSWLRAGAHAVHSLQKYARTDCGYASIGNVETKAQEDYMPSFFLSETCKYLYLLFNDTHFFRRGGYVMTTEAHPFPVLPTKLVAPILQAGNKHEPLNRTHFPGDRGLQCLPPSFSDHVEYSIEFEGEVVSRTPRCSKAKAAKEQQKTSTTSTTAAKGAITTGLEQWLPKIEEKLRRQFDFLYRKEDDEPELTVKSFIMGDAQHGGVAVPTPSGTKQDWLRELLHGEAPAADSNLMDGPGALGQFDVSQSDGVMRFTRQATGDWLEVSGVSDALHMLVTVGRRKLPEIPTARRDTTKKTEEEEEWNPALQPTHHVHKLSTAGDVLPLSTRCTLKLVATALDIDDPRQARSPELPFACVPAAFGIADELSSSLLFGQAPVVTAMPRDGCGELINPPEELRGAIVLIARGTCYFETKVRNAAAHGAAGVVIINTEDDAYRVMVMGGSGVIDDESGEDENGSGSDRQAADPAQATQDLSQTSTGKSGDDGGVKIPVVMISRGMGEWLERSYLSNGRFTIQATIDLAVWNRDQRPPVDDILHRGGRAFPYVDGLTSDNLRLYGPEWGVQMVATTTGDTGYHSYAIGIVETPQYESS